MSEPTSDITPEKAYRAIEQFIAERDSHILKDMEWVNSNLAHDQQSEQTAIKDRDAKIARRNQVLYCVANIDKQGFKYSDIEAFIRQRFPNTNQGTVLNVTNAMSELANENTGLLMRTPKGDGYMLKEPLYRKCLQSMLRCAENSEMVEKANIIRK